MRFSKVIVITTLTTLHLFTVAGLVFAWYSKFVPDILVERFFTVIGVQICAGAMIAIIKAIFGNKEERDAPLYIPD